MNRFVIEKALIEKSDKDINVGSSYQFCSGLNLICGDNEAGKTSLMNFIKTALFLKNNGDTGSVFFNISEQNYVIQISKSNSKNIVYSLSNNTKIDADFIKQHIPQKEFNHIFSINLDDLMGIKDESTKTLINLMKDSSCEYLNTFVYNTEKKLSQIWGKNNVIKDFSKLKNEINNLNKEIKEQSNKEKNYNEIIFQLNNLNEELAVLEKQQNNFENIEKINKINEKVNILEAEYKSLLVNFNPNLIDKNEEYIKLTEDSFLYNNNIETIKSNEIKIEDLNSKIFFYINKLKKEFGIELSEKELIEFSIDCSKTRKIMKSIEEINSIINSLSTILIEKKNIEESINNIEQKIDILNSKYQFSNSLNELEDLYKYLDNNLKYYNYLQNQIEESKNQFIASLNGIIPNKILIILSILMLILTGVSCYYKMYNIGIITSCAFIAFCIILLLINKSKSSIELKENKLSKDKIFNELKEKIKDIVPEIIEANQSLTILKINDLKLEVYNKKEQLSEKISEKNKQKDKLNNINSQIQNLEERKKELHSENKEIITPQFANIELSENEYLQIIDTISAIKDIIEEKNKFLNANENCYSVNNEIQNKLRNFVIENKIEIPFDDEYSQKIEKLKSYYLENSTLNKKLESIKIKIDSLNEEKTELEKITILNNKENDKSLSHVELDFEISQKNKLKETLLGQKFALEHSESIENLKMKKNVLQDKYDNSISSLLKDKIILALCEKAKMNFDKKQPNIQKAQEFLSIMTDGKYTKINLENELIQNESATKIKEWKNLSRGTKELLYFSLRMGFAYNYSKDKNTLEPNGKLNLPIIIDDAFVNFDSIRTKNAIKCLIEFSKTNQVLFFTCHTETIKKYFEELCPDFNIVSL